MTVAIAAGNILYSMAVQMTMVAMSVAVVTVMVMCNRFIRR